MTITYIKSDKNKEKSAEDQMKETKLEKGMVFSFSRNDGESFTCVVIQHQAHKLSVIGLGSWNRHTDKVLTTINSVYDAVYDEDNTYSDFIIYSKVSIELTP